MIELVIDARRRDLGGFEVGRVLPSPRRRMVGPFVFFDHMGPANLPQGTHPFARVPVCPQLKENSMIISQQHNQFVKHLFDSASVLSRLDSGKVEVTVK